MKWNLICDDNGYYYEREDSVRYRFRDAFNKLFDQYKAIVTYTDGLSEFEKVKQDLISVQNALYALMLIDALSEEDYANYHVIVVSLLDAIKTTQSTMEEGE